MKKRSYSESSSQQGQDDSACEVIAVPSTKNSSTSRPPIIIEVDHHHDDDCAASNKRARISSNAAAPCESLNLLVKAMECIQRDDDVMVDNNDKQQQPMVCVDRVPSMKHEIGSSTGKHELSACSSFSESSPPPVKSISIPSSKPMVGGGSLLLPMGRPLLAPPRLPTNLRPGQILVGRRTTTTQATKTAA